MVITTLQQAIEMLTFLGYFVILAIPSLALKYIIGQEPFVKGRVFGMSRANAVLTAVVLIAIVHAKYGLGTVLGI